MFRLVAGGNGAGGIGGGGGAGCEGGGCSGIGGCNGIIVGGAGITRSYTYIISVTLTTATFTVHCLLVTDFCLNSTRTEFRTER
jgi:hypothetical protein